MSVNNFNNTAYGLGSGLFKVFNPPIVSSRNPTVNDKAPIGTEWVNDILNRVFFISSIHNNLATWVEVETAGGPGVFTSLTVNPGPTNLSTVGNGTVTIGNAANTGTIFLETGVGNLAIVGNAHQILIGNDAAANLIFIGNLAVGAETTIQGGNGAGIGTAAIIMTTAATGDIQIGGTSHTGTIYLGVSTAGDTLAIGNAVNTGAQVINIASGASGANSTVNILAGNATAGVQTLNLLTGTQAGAFNLATASATPVRIGSGGTGTVAIGNATGNTLVTGTLGATGTITSSAGSVVGATGLTATVGNITALNGNIGCSTAANYFFLPGPVFIQSGAGVPANGLALHAGDMYINTTPTMATDRIFVATGVGAWTNVTCAA